MAAQREEESWVAACGARKARQGPSRRRLPSRRRQRVHRNLLGVPPQPDDVEEAREALAALARLRSGELPEQQEMSPPAEVVVKREERGTRGWTQLQQRLERCHGWQVKKDLGLETVLEPVFPEKHVQKRFLDACKELDHSMLLTYHGTRSANFRSIEQKGLLVPGHGGVKVAHGSAHGVGIYTAQLGKASLSQGFSDSSSLFLCAVCDTSEPPEGQSQEELNNFVPSGSHVQTRFPRSYMFQGKRFGNHQLKQESEEVRHVGDAVVVFKEKCVVPVFIATVLPSQPKQEADELEKALRPREECWELGPQQVGRKRIVVPEGRDNLIRFGSCRSGRSGRTVWLPPMPKESPSHHELYVVRRRNQRDWQLARMRGRAAKREDCFGRA